MSTNFEHQCRKLLTELGLIEPDEAFSLFPLQGGVASDIAKVEAANTTYCVKFALPKLKVKADWFAPIHRNSAEYAWLQVAAQVAPASALRLFGQSKNFHGFAMEFLEGEDIYLWKSALLSGAPDKREAPLVGDLLARIHAASTKPDFDASAFQNRDDFHALRIEPYLLYTATQHTDVAQHILQLAEELYRANKVLVHGDVSPKNILFRQNKPIILDAECASMGDACFDLGFCLNHLILKSIHLPACSETYLLNAKQLWQSYLQHVDWESVSELESRTCKLLPVLMLARVDGKSPVEYLSDKSSNQVRDLALQLIRHPITQMDGLVDLIHTQLEQTPFG